MGNNVIEIDDAKDLAVMSKNLKMMMEKIDIDVDFLAARTGIAAHTLELYLDGKCFPPADDLTLLSAVLGVPVKDIAGGEEIKFTSFGDELVALRKEQNLSRRELSEMIGISQSSIIRLESGELQPSEETAGKLIDLFGPVMGDIIKKYYPNGTLNKVRDHFTRAAVSAEDKEAVKIIANNIRRYRKRYGLTNNVIAKELGCSEWTINVILSGDRIPTEGTLKKLETCLHAKAGDLQVKRRMVKKTSTKAKGTVKETATAPTETIVTEEIKKTVSDDNSGIVSSIKFEKSWYDAAKLIRDDTAFRQAITAIFDREFYKKEIPDLSEWPEAAIFVMLAK